MGYRLSEDAAVDFLENADIGGTNASNEDGWVSMADYNSIYAKVKIGTWDSSDDLDECRIQQATDSSGTSAKDLTSDESGGNYDTDSPVDADGNTVVLEADASDMDADNGFSHVRLYVAEGGNTGPDNIYGTFIRYNSATKKAQKEGAASSGATVYVNTDS